MTVGFLLPPTGSARCWEGVTSPTVSGSFAKETPFWALAPSGTQTPDSEQRTFPPPGTYRLPWCGFWETSRMKLRRGDSWSSGRASHCGPGVLPGSSSPGSPGSQQTLRSHRVMTTECFHFTEFHFSNRYELLHSISQYTKPFQIHYLWLFPATLGNKYGKYYCYFSFHGRESSTQRADCCGPSTVPCADLCIYKALQAGFLKYVSRSFYLSITKKQIVMKQSDDPC